MSRLAETQPLDHQDEYGYGLFSVILKETGELIGDCGLEQMEDMGGAELGYDFRSDFWNQGYATEAAIAVRDYAFEVLKLPLLISLIRVGNLASKRVAEKVGMTLTEEFTRYDIRYFEVFIEKMPETIETDFEPQEHPPLHTLNLWSMSLITHC